MMGWSGLDKLRGSVDKQTTEVFCVFFQTGVVHSDRKRSYESVL